MDQYPASLESAPQPEMTGIVLAVQANFYRVKLHRVRVGAVECAELSPDELSPDEFPSELLCTRRSRLKKIGQQVMVGDQVRIAAPDWQGQRGAIAEVLPRHSQLQRPPVANANQLLLVFALAKPALDPYQLSRFLVTAAATGLEICVGLSKQDLVSDAELQAWLTRLQSWGYPAIPLTLAAEHRGMHQGLAALQRQLANKITVVSGPSGVGKSSLINALIPHLNVRVGEVSSHWHKGKHTTRHVELFTLPSGGLLADTPGFNQPALLGSAEHLATYFPEIQVRLQTGSCQFADCWHQDEPNCVVRGDWERYPHYREFLAEVLAQAAAAATTIRVPESTLKRKSRSQGQVIAEPKLDPKHYRRTSRRSQQQQLQQLYDEDTAAR